MKKNLPLRMLMHSIFVLFLALSLLATQAVFSVKAASEDTLVKFIDKLIVQTEDLPTKSGADINLALELGSGLGMPEEMLNAIKNLNLNLNVASVLDGAQSRFSLRANLHKKSAEKPSLSLRFYNIGNDFYAELPGLLEGALHFSEAMLSEQMGAQAGFGALMEQYSKTGTEQVRIFSDFCKESCAIFNRHAVVEEKETVLEAGTLSETVASRESLIAAEKAPAFFEEFLNYIHSNEEIKKLSGFNMNNDDAVSKIAETLKDVQEDPEDYKKALTLKVYSRENGDLVGLSFSVEDPQDAYENGTFDFYELASGNERALKISAAGDDADENFILNASYKLDDKNKGSGVFEVTSAGATMASGSFTELGLVGKGAEMMLSGSADMLVMRSSYEWVEKSAETTESESDSEDETSEDSEPGGDFQEVTITSSVKLNAEIKEGRNFLSLHVVTDERRPEMNLTLLCDYQPLPETEFAIPDKAPEKLIDASDPEKANNLIRDPEFSQKLVELVTELGIGFLFN